MGRGRKDDNERIFKLTNLHAYVYGRNQLFGRDPLVMGINTLGGTLAMG